MCNGHFPNELRSVGSLHLFRKKSRLLQQVFWCNRWPSCHPTVKYHGTKGNAHSTNCNQWPDIISSSSWTSDRMGMPALWYQYENLIPLPVSDTPSVLWHCWLGCRKGTRPVKNWVVRCWHGYLVTFPVQAHLGSPRKGPLKGCVCTHFRHI